MVNKILVIKSCRQNDRNDKNNGPPIFDHGGIKIKREDKD